MSIRVLLLPFVFLSFTSLAQETRVWEIEKHDKYMAEKRRQDSLNVLSRRYVPAFAASFKSQFPIQHGIGLEFNTPSMLSLYVGFGLLSRLYVTTATDFLPAEDENEAVRKQFIKDKMQNGFVFELGTHYHLMKWKDVYFGLNLQFQRYTLPATPQELVEQYDFGDTQGLGNDIQDQLDDNDFLQDFYENTEIIPTLRIVQVGFTVGKRFHFKRVPKLGLLAEFSYQVNLASSMKLNSKSSIGQIILDRFVSPILDEGTSESFGSFNLPTLTLRLNYQLGPKVYTK